MNATDDSTVSADIVSATADYVAGLFRDHSDHQLSFHNYLHTSEVVQAAREIGMGEGLSDDDLEIVTVAAWLHDVGYFQSYRGHEEKSAEVARSFLAGQGYGEERIAKVVACIMSTRYPQRPRNLPEQVLCDADMAHLGGDDAAEKADRLRRERLDCCGERYDDREWCADNLRFMRSQRFHTAYARNVFGGRLLEHIKEGEMELERLTGAAAGNRNGDRANVEADETNERDRKGTGPVGETKALTDETATAVAERRDTSEKTEKKEKKEKKIKKLRKDLKKIQEELEGALAESGDGTAAKKTSNSAARLDRGIETMFKTTSRNHIDLSAMADSKANIMISVNSIIISIVASVLLGKLDTDPHYIIPTVILLGVCLTTIIFAIIATRPKVTSGTFTQEDIEAKKVNLLFFGNFHSVGLENYQRGVTAMMNDSDYLYGSMIKDIYFLGQVLGRKYRYLRYSYNTFMYGLIAAVLAFCIAVAVGAPPAGPLQP